MAKYKLTDLLESKKLNEAWDDGINWKAKETLPEVLADRLAEIGAGYYDLSEEDIYDYAPDDWNSVDEVEHAAEILEKIGEKLNQYPLLYSYYKAEDGEFVILFSDGSYLTAQDWGKDDLKMVQDAGAYGRLDEEVDIEDDRIDQMIKAYAVGNWELANPDPYRNAQSFASSKNSYVFVADYPIYDAAENKNFSTPIHEYAQGTVESEYYQRAGREATVELFYSDYEDQDEELVDLAREFYGLEDEIDAEMLRDAGYEDAANWWKSTEEYEIQYRLDEEYTVELVSAVEIQNYRGKEVLFQMVEMFIKENDEREDVIKVIYQTRDEFDSVEDLKNLLDSFSRVIADNFRPATPPVETIEGDEDESLQTINEDQGIQTTEGWLEYFSTNNNKYVEIPDEILDDINDSFDGDETDVSFAMDEIGKYIDKANKKHGVGQKYGDTPEEYDGDFYTIVDWPSAFPNADDYTWRGYSNYLLVWDDDFEELRGITDQQAEDIKDVGRFNLSENQVVTEEEEDEEWEPDYSEDIEDFLMDTIRDIIDNIDRNVNAYGGGDMATMTGEGWQGAEQSTMTHLSSYLGNSFPPTEEAGEVMEKREEAIRNDAHEYAVEEMGKSGAPDEAREVYQMFGGDPDDLTEDNMFDAEQAYLDAGDGDTARLFNGAIEYYQEVLYDIINEDEQGYVYFIVQGRYYEPYTEGSLMNQPTIEFIADVEDSYGKTYATKEFAIPFSGKEEMEEVVAELAREVEDFLDGTDRRKEWEEERKKKQNLQ
jgi:hypothetical protein